MAFDSPFEWWNFRTYLLEINRFRLTEGWESFVQDLMTTSKKRTSVFKSGEIFFRARTTYKFENRTILPSNVEEMCAPNPRQCEAGRFNPHGLPYLYLATDKKTAISECRAWVGAWVSVAQFALQKEITVLDTRKDTEISFSVISQYNKDQKSFSQAQLESYVWGDMNMAFSHPIAPGDKSLDYIPTQFFGELFKKEGFDGIVCKSSLSKTGQNLVLFNPQNAKPIKGGICYVRAVDYDFDEKDNSVIYDMTTIDKSNPRGDGHSNEIGETI